MKLSKLRPDALGRPRALADFYESGRRVRRVMVGTIPEIQAVLARRLAEVGSQNWAPAPAQKLDTLASTYIAEKSAANVRPSYLAALARRLAEVGRTIGNRKAREISPGMVSGWLQARAKQVQPSTLRKERAMLAAFFGWCVHRGECPVNPIRGTMPIRVADEPARFLTPSEFALLHGMASDALRPALRVLVATGLRAGELCALTYEQVRAGAIRLPGDSRKSGKPLDIPCSPELASLLEEVTGKWSPGLLRREIQKAARLAGLEDVTPHTMRHTCATWLCAAGVPIYTVQRQVLGHSSVTVTERYAKLLPPDVFRAEMTMLPEGILRLFPFFRTFSLTDTPTWGIVSSDRRRET